MNYTVYTLLNNSSSITRMAEYANYVTGDYFTVLVQLTITIVFVLVFYPFTKERSLVVSLFLSLWSCGIFVLLGLLNPLWLLIYLIALAAGIYFLGRVSQ